MHDHPHVPRHIDTISDGITVRVWMEPDPAMPAVLVHIDEWEQELHLPLGVAMRVADAISRAAAPIAVGCNQTGCVA